MINFINRKKELKDFNNFFNLSKKTLFPIVLFGERRVGKTRLIKEFSRNKKYLYFFVDDSKNSKILLNNFIEILENENLLDEFIKLNSWDEFILFLFKKCNNYVIIFDEFQNFINVEKTIFSILQNNLDEFENKTNLMIIFLGSIVGMMKQIFEDEKKPLFGRIKNFYHLKPFSFKDSIKLSNEIGIYDLKKIIELYSFFGGYPRYYALIKEYNFETLKILDIIENLVLLENSILNKEVLNTLKLNFGNGKQNYYSILEAIGIGKRNVSEIANYSNLSVNATNFFISELRNFYGFIERIYPITLIKKKSKKIILYKLKNNFFDFYFSFIHKNNYLMEFYETKKIKDVIKINYNKFISFKFEDICREFMKEINSNYIYGTWWNRQGIEIDICGINKEENKKEILFGEVKWKDNVDARKMLNDLREKTQYVKWFNEERKEEYVIFAKSFKIEKKERRKFEQKNNCKLYDLNDLEKVFK